MPAYENVSYSYSLDPTWPSPSMPVVTVSDTNAVDEFNAALALPVGIAGSISMAGSMYVDATTNAVYVSDGTSWNRMASIGDVVAAQLGCVLTDDTLAAMEASDREEEDRLHRMLLDLRAKLDE